LKEFCAFHDAQLWLQGEGEPQPVDLSQTLGYRLKPGIWNWPTGRGFVQVNAGVNEHGCQALDWLAPQADERVLDLFCGLGNFAYRWRVTRSGGGGRCTDHGRTGCAKRRQQQFA
jgi:23S rRNA (uracil1939-C5)-methyltransferase